MPVSRTAIVLTCRICDERFDSTRRDRTTCDRHKGVKAGADPALVLKREAEREMAAAAPAGTKWCPRCENYLPIAQFGRRPSGNPQSFCFPCQKGYLHETRIQKLFGIDAAEYQRILTLQGGRCAICRQKPRSKNLAVDHDHETGEVRGLLCTRCNHKLLGSAHDKADILLRAAAYLKAPPALVGSVDHLGEGELLEAEEKLRELVEAGVERPLVTFSIDGEMLVLSTVRAVTKLLREAGYLLEVG